MSEMGHNGGPDPVWMDNPGSWIALSRAVREHPIVGFGQPVSPASSSRGSFSRGEAWIDLLCLAQYRPARVNNRGEVVTLQVGQLLGARAFLAQRWNWSDKTVRVFLETLMREGMIEGVDAESARIKGQQICTSPRNKAAVLSICNYDRYQLLTDAISDYIKSLQGPARGQQRASNRASSGASTGASNLPFEGPANHQQYQSLAASEGQRLEPQRASTGASTGASAVLKKGQNLTPNTRKEDSPLPPASGGAPELVLDGEPASRASARRKDALSLVELYNAAAKHHGWQQCRIVTPAIEQALLRRVRDIGGREQFVVALNQIPTNDFLMGRLPGRNGAAPFRLDLTKLLSTRSGMGDVLAGLIDAAAVPAASARYWWQDPAKVASLSEADWQHLIAKHCVDGLWSIDKVGWPPGHSKCVVPPGIVTALRLTDLWTSDGFART